MEWFGRTLIIVGVLIVILGAFLYFGGKVPGIGRLPGDILIQRGNFTLYFPLATAILLSIIHTVVLNLNFRR